MSSNYSAGQFNDAFSPKRLGNWEDLYKNIEQRPRLEYKCPTEFIANERGHLLPGVPRKRISPWGCLNKCCLSRAFPCQCTEFRQYKSEAELLNDKRNRIPSFFTQKKPKPKKGKVIRPPAARNIMDPYLNYLRDIQLPTIWIVGLQTESIQGVRKKAVQQLAKSIDFCYIELEEQIQKWNTRMNESSQKEKTKLSDTEDSQFNSHCHTSESDVLKISFDTFEPFTTDKILELLKFAMIEGLPCHGFMLDGFPCNLEEAGQFERVFYPAALGLYFIAGTLDTISGYKVKQKDPKNPKKRAGFDRIIQTKLFRRKNACSYSEVMQVCNEYGRKLVQVIETEDTQGDTVDFLHDLVRKNLEKYPEMLAGNNIIEIDCNIADYSSSSSLIHSDTPADSSESSLSISETDRSWSEESLSNNPPPLINCTASVSYIFPLANKTLTSITSCSRGTEGREISRQSWKEEIENLKSNIKSRILPTRDDHHSVIEHSSRSSSISTIVARPDCRSPFSDPDERPLPVSGGLEFLGRTTANKAAEAEQEQIQSETIDVGAFGDRVVHESISRIMGTSFRPELTIPLESIEELGAWFDATMHLHTPVQSDEDDVEAEGDCNRGDKPKSSQDEFEGKGHGER